MGSNGKRKIATFGSCLSRFTANYLVADFSFEQLSCVFHVMSDQFIKYYVEKTHILPDLEWLESLFVPGDDPEAMRYASGMLRNQYPAQMGLWEFPIDEMENKIPFLDLVEKSEVDLIILDNFIDLSSWAQYYKLDPNLSECPIQFVSHLYKNQSELIEKFEFGGYINPKDSAHNYFKIMQWLRFKQPNARIAFLCFFGCTSQNNPERQSRALEFYKELDLLSDGQFLVVPPLEVPIELQKESDWTHVDNSIYRALAGKLYVELFLTGSL